MKSLGKHVLIEYHGCERALIQNVSYVREQMLEAVKASNGTIVTDVFHEFSPHGLSGVVVISESHVAIHTWPEHDFAAVDIFSCNDRLQKKQIETMLQAAFKAERVLSLEVERGKIPFGLQSSKVLA